MPPPSARIRDKLGRLRDAYLEGDLDKGEYQARKAALTKELEALPAEGDAGADAGRRLAEYLADVAAAWRAATAEERNQLARQLFNGVVIDNRTAVAVTPRPDLLPFFETLACQVPDEMTLRRKRRGSVTRDSCCQTALDPLFVLRTTAAIEPIRIEGSTKRPDGVSRCPG